MSFLRDLFFPQRRGASDVAYQRAVSVSDDLLSKMQESSNSNDAARTVIANIWAKHHNIPFLTSVYETVQEMNVGTVSPLNGHRSSSAKK